MSVHYLSSRPTAFCYNNNNCVFLKPMHNIFYYIHIYFSRLDSNKIRVPLTIKWNKSNDHECFVLQKIITYPKPNRDVLGGKCLTTAKTTYVQNNCLNMY